MNNIINVHQLKTHYSHYLEQVLHGEEVLLGKHGKAVAKIVPLTETRLPRTPGALKGKIWVSDDFDKPMIGLWKTVSSKR